MEKPQSVLQKEKITKQREKVMDQLFQIKDEVSGFEPFLPTLLTYLQCLCNSFKAGQVATHFITWRTLTSDSVLLSDVLGATIECVATPVQHRLPHQAFSEGEYPIVIRRCINWLRKVSLQRHHLCLDKFCLAYFSAPRRMDPIALYLI